MPLNHGELPASMERHECFCAIGQEHDVQGCLMREESQSWRYALFSAECVVDRAILFKRKLASDCHASHIRYARVPESITIRIAIIPTLVFCGAVEKAMIVDLFTWVILMDIDSISLNLAKS